MIASITLADRLGNHHALTLLLLSAFLCFAQTDRTIRQSESHAYPIAFEAGQYLRVTSTQQGIDIALSLRAPSGQSLVMMSAPWQRVWRNSIG